MTVIATEKIFPVFWKAIHIFQHSPSLFILKMVLLVHSIIAFIYFPCRRVNSRAPELSIDFFEVLFVAGVVVCLFFQKGNLSLVTHSNFLPPLHRMQKDVLMEKFHLGLNSPKSPHLCTTLSGGTLFSFPSTLRNFFDESGVRYWSMPIVISLGVILSLHYFFRVTAVDFPLSLCLI